MPPDKPIKIAVLDDYQGLALQMADWSELRKQSEIVVFRDHLADADTVVQRLAPFDVVCANRERTPLPRSILERLPKLKLIATTGMRNAAIDLQAAKERGITVCGTLSLSHGTPELTWALILAMVRQVPTEAESMRRGGWQNGIGTDLYGKTLGILGLGRIGAPVARVARAFGMKLIAWSQNLTPEVAEQHWSHLVSKEALFREADIVTVHLVLSGRTRGVIGERELRWMKPTAYLVNTSRGALVNEGALIAALQNRAIAGAALDVYEIEPLPEAHPFRSLDNVVATPHIGFVTRETYKIFYRETVENISAWLRGRPLRVIELPN